MSDPENPGEKKVLRPWQDERGRIRKGCAVPGAGKPRGPHRASLIAQALIDAGAEEIVARVVAMARAGDPVAIRLVVERILPPRKIAPINLELPKLESAADAARAVALVIEALAGGEILADQAAALLDSIRTWTEVAGAAELEARIARLEGAA